MSGQVVALLKTGLALKLSQVKLAANSYVEDRTDHAKSVATSYAVGAGYYAAAGAFFVAACLVGVGALFHYIEIAYGSYTAFAVAGGVLVLMAIVTAAVAAMKMKPPAANYTSLMDRLKVAITGRRVKSSVLSRDQIAKSAAATKPVSKRAADSRPAPLRSAGNGPARNPVESARSAAADILRSPASAPPVSQGVPAVTKAGAALAVTMLGWALARRFGQTGRSGV